MGVAGEEQGAVCPHAPAVVAYGLGGGGDVVLVEAGPQARPPVPRGPKRDALIGDRWVGVLAEVGGDQARHVHEVGGRRRLAGAGTYRHGEGPFSLHTHA